MTMRHDVQLDLFWAPQEGLSILRYIRDSELGVKAAVGKIERIGDSVDPESVRRLLTELCELASGEATSSLSPFFPNAEEKRRILSLNRVICCKHDNGSIEVSKMLRKKEGWWSSKKKEHRCKYDEPFDFQLIADDLRRLLE